MEAVRNKRRNPIIALYFLLPTVNEKTLKASYLCFQADSAFCYKLVPDNLIENIVANKLYVYFLFKF